MTDPKDLPPPTEWPTGLKKLLDEMGANSLIELHDKLIRERNKKAPVIANPSRLPYVDKDEEPD